MHSTAEALMSQVSTPPPCTKLCTVNKVTVIGAGSVGSACVFALLTKNITSELVLIDKDTNQAKDELTDMSNASVYLNNPTLTFGSDYDLTYNSKIIIITAGQHQTGTGIDEEVVKTNTEIFKEIIPQLMIHSPRCILIVTTPPVDIMSYVAWKLSGLPPQRVIGTGCSLITARFRFQISQEIRISPDNVQAYVIGEHGPRCIPVWSGVSVCGVKLRDINPDIGTDKDPEDWKGLFENLTESLQRMNMAKNSSTWGMAATVSKIVTAILNDTKECLPLSTHIKGCRHVVEKNKDVYLSLPCVLGNTGVMYVIRQSLTVSEKNKLQESANVMQAVQAKLKF